MKLPRSTIILVGIGFLLMIYFIFIYHAFNKDFFSSTASDATLRDMEKLIGDLEAEHKLINHYIEKLESQLNSSPTVSSREANTQSNLRKESKNNQAAISSSTKSAENTNIKTTSKAPPTSVIPDAMTFSSPENDNAVLVVGGTDGSGTRRVVQILAELGVTMVSEDPETHDIHADLIGGWPPVVKKVLQHAHSLDYDPKTFPSGLSQHVDQEITKLLHQAELDSHKPTSYKLAVGGVLPKRDDVSVHGVRFGFKAPVAMTLVPWWAHKLDRFKFIHVLRDGRDISFSANQGPVEKFYNDMYSTSNKGRGNMALRPEEKAIKLWSDWNSQVYNWARKTVDSLKSSTSTKESSTSTSSIFSSSGSTSSLGYLVVHTEDLVSETRQVRFAAIKHIADFVKSEVSDEDICCLASKDAEFMGSHDRTPRRARGSHGPGGSGDQSQVVKQRYGKWKSRFDQDPNLGNSLQELGKEALATFGYDPMRILATEDAGTASGFVCSDSTIGEKCNLHETNTKNDNDGKLPSPDENSPYGAQGKCRIYARTDFQGGDINSVAIHGRSAEECCMQCLQSPECHHFTLDANSEWCYLKSSRGHIINPVENGKKLFSGDVL